MQEAQESKLSLGREPLLKGKDHTVYLIVLTSKDRLLLLFPTLFTFLRNELH